MARAIILMLDSLGIGGAPDADKFGDLGSNTFQALIKFKHQQHQQHQHQQLKIPHLEKLGLFEAAKLSSDSDDSYSVMKEKLDKQKIIGAFGACNELSFGKDTPSGHWEMAGVPVLFDFGFFKDKTNSFPKELLDKIIDKYGMKKNGYLGNCHASGTDILEKLGAEHIETGYPIFYTSADSVFQIACHEEHFGLENLYKLCKIAREELAPYNIGRVIARPFIGDVKNGFKRTGNRHDYSLNPPGITILEKLVTEQPGKGKVVGVGKIADIYANQGISEYVKATGFDELFDKTLQAMKDNSNSNNTIIFTNFVDFDSSFGHRRDIAGYVNALEEFDVRLPEILSCLDDDDILYITADHGCDPSWTGTDHTRERVPILIYGKTIIPGSLGIRNTFADIGQTIAKQLDLTQMDYGVSMI